MQIFNASSLGIGSSTNLNFHSQFLSNDFPQISSCNPNSVHNYTPFCNNFMNLYRKCSINRYPVVVTQINASSDTKVDDFLDGSPVSPPRSSRNPVDWEAAKKYKESGSIYEGRVEGFNNGGLLVRFHSLVGFLPFPQLSPLHSCKESGKTIQEIARGLVGSNMLMKVIDAVEESKKLIFSEKDASWSRYSEKVNIGDIFEAKVGMVESYGAFLHLRFPDDNYHLTGLLHISEVSWDYVQDVRDVLKEGDSARVKVVDIDREKSRITLSIRQLEDDPLLETLDKVIPQDSPTSPDSATASESVEIEPLPGLNEIFAELLKEDGITDVRIRRQGFEKRVVSQDLQLWLSNAPATDDQYTLLARAGRQVHKPGTFTSYVPLFDDKVSYYSEKSQSVGNRNDIVYRIKKVQEIQMTTSLDQEGIKKALQRALERVP